MTRRQADSDPNRASVDVGAIQQVASQLLPASSGLRDLAAALLRHAPDPGTPPAPDAVLDVQTGAVDTLNALAAALQESSQLLVLTARRYTSAEEDVVRALRRLGPQNP